MLPKDTVIVAVVVGEENIIVLGGFNATWGRDEMTKYWGPLV